MTNRNMVADPTRKTGEYPKPNHADTVRVLAPESDGEAVFTDHDPADSPQPHPEIRQRKTRGLRER